MNIKYQKQITFFILGAILILGFCLRAYSINFPSIGYHNLNENTNLSIAQEMERTNDFVTNRVYFYNAFEQDSGKISFSQPSLIPYHILLAWRIFGDNLWGARLINIIFGILSILMIYFMALLLFRNRWLSLYCAFLLAIMPLAVFFSRNLQPEGPALFFMILGNLFYLRFAGSIKKYNLVLGGIFLSIAVIYQGYFLIGLIPAVFCFPYKRLWKKKEQFYESLLAFIIPFVAVGVFILWLNRMGMWQISAPGNLFMIFRPAYWIKNAKVIWFFISNENYTPIYTLLALVGVSVAIFEKKILLNRYIMGWGAAILIYFIVFPNQIRQNNYYQMPFLVFVCVSSVYALSYATAALRKIFTEKLIKIAVTVLIMVLTIFLSASGVYNALTKSYGTAFLGLDVAGESLREFLKPDELFFLNTHPQGRGIARYAKRYAGWAKELDDFKDKEKKFDIKYICIYPMQLVDEMREKNSDLFKYISDNYHLKETGLAENDALFYVILEKGKGSDPETFLTSVSGQKELRAMYKIVNQYVSFHSVRPEQ